MSRPRTIRDLIANLSTLDPDMEVAAVEALDVGGTGVDLRTVAGFLVSATGRSAMVGATTRAAYWFSSQRTARRPC